MARVPVYQNSILASLLSLAAYLLMFGGVSILFSGDILPGIGMFLTGMLLAFLGAFLSEWKKSRAMKKRGYRR